MKDRIYQIVRSLPPRPRRVIPTEAFGMFLEYHSLRDIGHYYNTAHMVVAFQLRKAYGRYATNDKVLSVYRTLLRDYLPYKRGSKHQQEIYQKLKQWVYTEASKEAKQFSLLNASERYVATATEKSMRYYSKATETYMSKFMNIGDDQQLKYTPHRTMNDFTKRPLKGKVSQSPSSWWRVDFVVYLTTLSMTLIKELIECQLNEVELKPDRQPD